jgi:hypothetical protein
MYLFDLSYGFTLKITSQATSSFQCQQSSGAAVKVVMTRGRERCEALIRLNMTIKSRTAQRAKIFTNFSCCFV